METIYYQLNARRVKISGGPDRMTFSRPHAVPVPEGGGQLLDFERGKLRVERKALLKNALRAEPPLSEDPVPMETPRSSAGSRSGRLFLGLELLTSGAILAVCGVIIRVFTAAL